MKFLGESVTDFYHIEVYECTCGYHAGFDTSYLDQVGPIHFKCPACESEYEIEGDES